MTERTTYLDPSYTLASGAPKTIDGITFRPYRTGISRFARISDDGQIMVRHNSRMTGYNAYVIGHGPITTPDKERPKNFRDEANAYAAAIALFRKRAQIDAIIRAPKINVPTIGGTLNATRLVIGDAVSIDPATGAIERLPGFTTTDAAALAFWEAVERLAPNRGQQR